MPDIRLIALDLDGTLLNSQKELSQANARALARAAEKGIHIVPTTGRFFNAMPEVIRSLPFLRYAITINGAHVMDLQTGEVLYRAEIPCARALEIMAEMDRYDIIYDCYQDNQGYMTRSMWEKAGDYMFNPHTYKMVRELRKPVDDLKAYLAQKGKGIQKTQFFVRDPAVHPEMLAKMQALLPDMAVSSSLQYNVEINSLDANKGDAVTALCRHLGFSQENVMAFGDGGNDVSMLASTGYGICMANGCSEAKAAAKYLTDSSDEDGVASAINRFL